MIGHYNYDMLALGCNASDLQYVPCHYPERNKFVVSEH